MMRRFMSHYRSIPLRKIVEAQHSVCFRGEFPMVEITFCCSGSRSQFDFEGLQKNRKDCDDVRQPFGGQPAS
jgi:hypothetical protein